MSPAERLGAAAMFATTRWWAPSSPEALARHQRRAIARFLHDTLPRAPYYRARGPVTALDALPIVDKPTMLAHFAGFNTVDVSLDHALDVALAAEQSRDFAPTLPGGLTVGLSSGTSGARGVFLVSAAERARWAGALLALVLTPASLRQVLGLAPSRGPLTVAFFLRANSNLYTTLSSRRLAFHFHDLLEPIDAHLARLSTRPPDVLAAPSTVLRRLAEATRAGALPIRPRQVIAVAEVLEPDDAAVMVDTWGAPVQQVYQATEGFLGASCPAGRVHLNEQWLHVEREWLDGAHERFTPIVTDLARTTQLVVRYRLDDVLRLANGPCACGRPTTALAAIEGRADDVLWARALGGDTLVPVFPDVVRRAMAQVDGLHDYRVAQHDDAWLVSLLPHRPDIALAARAVIDELASRLGVQPPVVQDAPWTEAPLARKRRRIQCVVRPADGTREGGA